MKYDNKSRKLSGRTDVMSVRVHSVYDSPEYRTRKVTKLLRPYKSTISKTWRNITYFLERMRISSSEDKNEFMALTYIDLREV